MGKSSKLLKYLLCFLFDSCPQQGQVAEVNFDFNISNTHLSSYSICSQSRRLFLQTYFSKCTAHKKLPVRKTDIKDAEWIAHLLRSGLVESSFVSCENIRDLRYIAKYGKYAKIVVLKKKEEYIKYFKIQI
jgi:hypothetical protein